MLELFQDLRTLPYVRPTVLLISLLVQSRVNFYHLNLLSSSDILFLFHGFPIYSIAHVGFKVGKLISLFSYWMSVNIPTDPFTIFRLQNPEIDGLYEVRKHRSTDFQVLKL